MLIYTEGKIEVEALAQFRTSYVSGSSLASERRTSPRALAAALRLNGVEPVSGPSVDGGRQNFFRRADILPRKLGKPD